jgi:hypothetical protein
VQLADDGEEDATVITIDAAEGTPGQYFALFFSSAEFSGNVLKISQSRFPFTITDPILAVRDDGGNYVACGVTGDGDGNIFLTAKPFDGKVIVAEPGASGVGSYATHSFAAADFIAGKLTVPQSAIPFDLLDPLVAVRDGAGNYVSCAVEVRNYESVTLSAQPFTGRLILFRGDLVRVHGSHRIVGPTGTPLPDRNQLQFTGPAVQSVADDPTNGRTTVTLSPGGNATIGRISFTADQFVGNALTLGTERFPFQLTAPLIQVLAAQGSYVSPGLRLDEGNVVLEAEPFDGVLILIQ